MDIQVTGTNIECSFKRMLVLDTWLSIKDSKSELERWCRVFQALMQLLPDVENLIADDLEKRVTNLCTRFVVIWKQVSRKHSCMVSQYGDWLNEIEVCVLPTCAAAGSRDTQRPAAEASSSTQQQHRHRKDFEECSKRSKRRRLAELSKVDSSAINTLLNDSSRSDAAASITFSTDEVLSLINETKLTKHQHLVVKDFINAKSPNALPSYQKVLETKKRCYPSQEFITELSAEVELQSLLDHTACRILESQKHFLNNIDLNKEFVLIGKWGFDGSTGHSEYKQCFGDSGIENDGSMFVTSYCSLQLVCKSNTSDPDQIVWKNPRPSSTRYCRPIRFQFAKESKDLSVQEEAYFKSKIDNLQPSSFTHNGCEIKVQHSLQLTMVNGKVCSALSDTPCSRCYICGSTPKEMNDIDKSLSKTADSSKYQFGLSPLHSYIRFFEYFIYVSYRLDFKKWQARSSDDKALLAQKKQHVQQQFRQQLGLIVDKPRSGGSGTSNDGNTARRFFSNSAISAEITGLDKDLIDRCHNLLQCLSSGYKINNVAFKEYSLDTARKLVATYPWYNLPSSVHKVLIHGSEVIDHSLLSIGELSEEAAESCNKLVKQFRRDNTRKMSRVVTNTDLIHRLLLNSDPYISGLRRLPRKKKSILSKEVLNLLSL